MWLGPGGLLSVVMLFWSLVWLSRETTAGRAWFDVIVPLACLILGTGALSSANAMFFGWGLATRTADEAKRSVALALMPSTSAPLLLSVVLCAVFLAACVFRWRRVTRAPSTTARGFQVMSFVALGGMMAATLGGVALQGVFLVWSRGLSPSDLTGDVEWLGVQLAGGAVALLWGGLIDAVFWGAVIGGGRGYQRWKASRLPVLTVEEPG